MSRSIFAILLGVLGGAAVLVAAVFVAMHLRLPPDLSDILPAERTVAFVRHASKEDLLALQQTLPTIANALPESGTVTVALLRTDDAGATGWVLVPDDPTTQLPPSVGTVVRVSNLKVLVSSESVGTLLTNINEEMERLSDSDAYWSLTAGLGTDSFSVFFQHPAVSEGTGLLSAPLLRASSFLIARTPDGLRLRSLLMDDLAVGSRSIAATLALPSSSTTLSLSIAGEDTFTSWLGALPTTRAAALRGLLEQELRGLMGDDVSLTYDLLPLLRERAVVHVQEAAGTGTTLLLIDGTADNMTNVKKAIAALRERLHVQTGMRIDEQLFDGKYRSRIMRQEMAALQQIEETRGTWSITGITDAGGQEGILLASSGNRFLLATNRAWLDQVIDNQTETRVLPSTAGVRFAGGSMDASWIPWFLPTSDILPGEALLQSFLADATRLIWSAGLQGQMLEVALQKN